MKGVDIEEDCPLCEESMESVEHLFCDCNVVRSIWNNAMLEHLVCDRIETSFFGLFSALNRQQPQGIVELFFIICWSIWNGRNNRTRGSF